MDAEALRHKTVAELREEAKKLGDVKGVASMKKEELVQLLAGGDAAEPADPHQARKVRKAAGAMTLAQLKQKIKELKEQRAAAGARAAKSKVSEYNTDLRRYRRLVRKAARRRRNSS